jgi:hypothetical protein
MARMRRTWNSWWIIYPGTCCMTGATLALYCRQSYSRFNWHSVYEGNIMEDLIFFIHPYVVLRVLCIPFTMGTQWEFFLINLHISSLKSFGSYYDIWYVKRKLNIFKKFDFDHTGQIKLTLHVTNAWSRVLQQKLSSRNDKFLLHYTY